MTSGRQVSTPGQPDRQVSRLVPTLPGEMTIFDIPDRLTATPPGWGHPGQPGEHAPVDLVWTVSPTLIALLRRAEVRTLGDAHRFVNDLDACQALRGFGMGKRAALRDGLARISGGDLPCGKEPATVLAAALLDVLPDHATSVGDVLRLGPDRLGEHATPVWAAVEPLLRGAPRITSREAPDAWPVPEKVLATMERLGATSDTDLALWPESDLAEAVGKEGAVLLTEHLRSRGVTGNPALMRHIRGTVDTLRRYQHEHGHAAPTADEFFEGQPLGSRVAWLRSRARAGKAHSHLRWSVDQIPGWTWEPRASGGAYLRAKEQTNEAATQVAADLVTAIEQAMGETVPDVLRGAPQMVPVLTRLGRARHVMRDQDVARLERLPGWTWTLTHGTTARAWVDWWAKYDALLRFVAQHDRLPRNAETFEGVRLGRWIRDQRTPRHALHPRRADLLEQVPGWTWVHGHRPPGRQ